MAQKAMKKDKGDAKTRPVHVVRFGGVKAVVWLNQTDTGPFHNVTVSRSYKKDGEWHEAAGFGYADLLTLAKAVNAAHSWIHAQRAEKTEQAA